MGLNDESSASMWVWVAASIGLVGALIPSLRISGVFVTVLGILMNLAVVLLNYGMPVGATHSGLKLGVGSGFYHAVGQASIAAWLGDSMAVGTEAARFWLSPGDVVLGVGVAILLVGAMLNVDDDAAVSPS